MTEGTMLNSNLGTFLVSGNRHMELFFYQQCFHDVEQKWVFSKVGKTKLQV